ncbi:MAG: hypothetical protein IPJ65_21965 [Archangiaceae bacterium]|nr:hypothetical protein [Archangiaceae bacterium]
MGLFDKLFAKDGGSGERPAEPAKKQAHVSELGRRLAGQLITPQSSGADRNNLGALLTLLEKTATGWADVELVLQRNVKVQLDTAEGGALFVWPGNLIILNRMRAPRSLVPSFCHEATHARQQHGGRGSDPLKQSKDDFAEAVVRIKTEAFLREALVGRELMHWERTHGVELWPQGLREHPVQMWFALVHGARYGKRPSDELLQADAALGAPKLAEWTRVVQPYFRQYAEPYRIVQHIKWDIARGRRWPLDADTLHGVLEASFSKQKPAHRKPYRK